MSPALPCRYAPYTPHLPGARNYISVSKSIALSLTCRGVRRAVATHAVIDYKRGKIGFRNGEKVDTTEFLCHLATVMNTSIPVLLDHYVQVRFLICLPIKSFLTPHLV